MSFPDFDNISALILACTHYPLIADEINEICKGKIEILSSPDIISKELLKVSGSISQRDRVIEKDHFFVSDFTESFEHSTIKFFGREIHLELMDLWS